MGFKCGIVGLPNVGKSTLFNALTETAAAQAAHYPVCTIEPHADIETIETELMLADLDSLEKRVDNLAKKAKGNDKDAKEALDLVNRALVLLREGRPARFLERKPEEERAFGMLGLLTSK